MSHLTNINQWQLSSIIKTECANISFLMTDTKIYCWKSYTVLTFSWAHSTWALHHRHPSWVESPSHTSPGTSTKEFSMHHTHPEGCPGHQSVLVKFCPRIQSLSRSHWLCWGFPPWLCDIQVWLYRINVSSPKPHSLIVCCLFLLMIMIIQRYVPAWTN